MKGRLHAPATDIAEDARNVGGLNLYARRLRGGTARLAARQHAEGVMINAAS